LLLSSGFASQELLFLSPRLLVWLFPSHFTFSFILYNATYILYTIAHVIMPPAVTYFHFSQLYIRCNELEAADGSKELVRGNLCMYHESQKR
jgi:hypothetical protein